MTRRILVAVSGLSPQILTETLYALAVQKKEKDKWIPDEIHLITTLRGKEHAALNLLSGKGWFHQLCRDYQLPAITFDAEKNIHLIKDTAGQALEDIRTPQDNEAAADTITERIRLLTQDENTEVHVSIAGGRKTMGYYAGYALSLFGRDQDRLSHVLVSAPYEGHREFFYPTPYEHVIHTDGPEKRTLDCQNAKVWLADIPFVRLRDGVQAPLTSGRVSFSQTVRSVLRPVSPELHFIPAKKTVIFGDKAVKLSDASYLLYAWMARRCKQRLGDLLLPKNDVVSSEMLMQEISFLDPKSDSVGKLDDIKKVIKYGVDDRWFSTNKSRLDKKLVQEFGVRLAEPYLIKSIFVKSGEKKKQATYTLQLDPSKIHF